jgi:hypothetical protein
MAVSVDCRYKALLRAVLSHTPFGEQLNCLSQRYVSRSLPGREAIFKQPVERAKEHILDFEKHSGRSISCCTLYEIGAGVNLAVLLVFYALALDASFNR